METEKSFSGEEAEKDFCGRLFFLAAIFPFSNEKACIGVIAKTDFFYRLKAPHTGSFFYVLDYSAQLSQSCSFLLNSSGSYAMPLRS